MSELLFHPLTQRQVRQFMASPGHALLLAGPAGSGKGSLSRDLAAKLLEASNLQDYPYKLIIEPEAGRPIGIEAVRKLEHFLSLKVPRPAAFKRLVIIEDAGKLTVEAQNGLLKTLEEPPSGTLIILTVNYEPALLPTVRSRLQTITVKNPPRPAILEYFKQLGYSESQISRVYAISGGLPGLMQALLDDAEHPLLQATEQARQLLASPVYGRLLAVDSLSRQKDLLAGTLFILEQMARLSLQSSHGQAAQRWQKVLKASFTAAEELAANAQPKLVLINLCLSF